MDIAKADGLYKLFKQTDEGARQKQVPSHLATSLPHSTIPEQDSKYSLACFRAWALEPALRPERLQLSRHL